MCCSAAGSLGETNWGKRTKKKMVSLGCNTLISTAEAITRVVEGGATADSTSTGEWSRQVQQVAHSRVLDDREGERTGVQYRCQPRDGSQQVRNDFPTCSPRRDEAGPATPLQPSRDGSVCHRMGRRPPLAGMGPQTLAGAQPE